MQSSANTVEQYELNSAWQGLRYNPFSVRLECMGPARY